MSPSSKKADEPSPSGQVDLQPAVPIIFSIGYEGRSLEEFIALLKAVHVERLIDVRDAPYSRKPGFSKHPLEQALNAASIEYIGIPELGTDKSSRDSHRTDSSIEPVLEEFRRKLERNGEQYERLKRLARERVSAIMCFEAEAKNCHRQVVEERMVEDGFRIVHLGGGKQERIDDINCG
jgi:uncharacterized protein (DUF488 family)